MISSRNKTIDLMHLPLARQSQPRCHMQTYWIRIWRRVSRRIIRIQAVCHSDKMFTIFERYWST